MRAKHKLIMVLMLVTVLTVPFMTAMPVFAQSTSQTSPTSDTGDFIGPEGAYTYAGDCSDSYGYSGCARATNGQIHYYYDYGFNIPPEATIKGIVVTISGRRHPEGTTGRFCVELSWSDGDADTWTSNICTKQMWWSQEIHNLGSPTEDWGHTWIVDEINNHLRVKVTADCDNMVYLDWIPVTVYYTVEDFGDAPDSDVSPQYPTLLVNDGARHVVNGPYLGARIDYEHDALASTDATGDDLDNTDDEDGVIFDTLLVKGRDAMITVNASGAGLLDAWLDANGDSDWDDAGEQVFTNEPLVAGENHISFAVPCSEVPPEPIEQTFMRFRFSTAGGLGYTGLADDGEVEDYAVSVVIADYGDAPSPYPTNDAYHLVVEGVYLGNAIDAECKALSNADATGDDSNNLADEDGVSFDTPLETKGLARIMVTASVPGFLNAWIDFNADGDWVDPSDDVFSDEPLSVGVNSLYFFVPTDAVLGDTFARFNFVQEGTPCNGEIEDYMVTIVPPTTVQVAVGGRAYPINKIGLIAPWIALAMVIAASSIYLIIRRVNNRI